MTGPDRDRNERRIAEAIASLPAAKPSAEFRRSLERSFVDGTIESSGKIVPIRSRMPIVLWAGLAAAAVLLISFFLTPGPTVRRFAVVGETAGTVLVDGRIVALSELRDGGLSPGSRITVQDGGLELLWSDVVAVRVNPGSVNLPDPDDPADLWDVARGEVLFQTGPGFPGRELHVNTPEGRVVVRGTSFAVFRDDGVTCVCVLDGVAAVGVDETDLEPVPPGKRKVMKGDGTAEILDIMPAHREGLVGFVDRAKAMLESD